MDGRGTKQLGRVGGWVVIRRPNAVALYRLHPNGMVVKRRFLLIQLVIDDIDGGTFRPPLGK
jgi:hypothetical protein